jgi:hypothetical protein
MATIQVRFSGVFLPDPIIAGSRQVSLLGFGNDIRQWLSGAAPAGTSATVEGAMVPAAGTVTIASGSGSITATINGVGVSTTWATSDTATAAALATAINASANALVSDHVTATSAAGVVTITAIQPGRSGNAITLAASGTGATASGARLTGGTSTRNLYSNPV